MIIIVANQKGGAGKTTHAMLFSNYLKLIKNTDMLVLDMDFQANFKSSWDKDCETYDNEPLYEVLALDLEESAPILEKLKDVDGHVIIDLPGKMDDDNLQPIYEAADLVICPFMYDQRSFESTHTFAQVVAHLNPDVPIVFLPNRLKAQVNYITKADCNRELGEFGVISPEISDKVAFQRADTVSIADDIKAQVLNAYNFIYDKFIKTK